MLVFGLLSIPSCEIAAREDGGLAGVSVKENQASHCYRFLFLLEGHQIRAVIAYRVTPVVAAAAPTS